MEELKDVDFTFLDTEEKKFIYSVMIITSLDIDEEQFNLFKKKSDYIICVDEAINQIYEKSTMAEANQEEFIDCILCDAELVKPEALSYFKSKNIKIINKTSQDMNKCLYYTLEKISNIFGDYNTEEQDNKVCSIFIMGLGERYDYTFFIIQNVHRYLNSFHSMKTEIYIIMKSSFSIFLINGINVIYPSKKYENAIEGYSIISSQDNIEIKIAEFSLERNITNITKNFKYSPVMFRKNFIGDKIEILIEGVEEGYVLYSTTTTFHD